MEWEWTTASRVDDSESPDITQDTWFNFTDFIFLSIVISPLILIFWKQWRYAFLFRIVRFIGIVENNL